jgi:hypothetical protein
MYYFLYSLISLVITITLLICIAILGKSDEYKETDKTLCTINNLDIPKKKCGVFDDGVCWKGDLDINSRTCTKPSNDWVLVLFILATIFFIIFVVYLIIGLKHKGKGNISNNFAYHSSDHTSSYGSE